MTYLKNKSGYKSTNHLGDVELAVVDENKEEDETDEGRDQD